MTSGPPAPHLGSPPWSASGVCVRSSTKGQSTGQLGRYLPRGSAHLFRIGTLHELNGAGRDHPVCSLEAGDTHREMGLEGRHHLFHHVIGVLPAGIGLFAILQEACDRGDWRRRVHYDDGNFCGAMCPVRAARKSNGMRTLSAMMVLLVTVAVVGAQSELAGTAWQTGDGDTAGELRPMSMRFGDDTMGCLNWTSTAACDVEIIVPAEIVFADEGEEGDFDLAAFAAGMDAEFRLRGVYDVTDLAASSPHTGHLTTEILVAEFHADDLTLTEFLTGAARLAAAEGAEEDGVSAEEYAEYEQTIIGSFLILFEPEELQAAVAELFTDTFWYSVREDVLNLSALNAGWGRSVWYSRGRSTALLPLSWGEVKIGVR